MPRQNLSSLSVEALLKLREEIGTVLTRKADALKKELASLGEDYAAVGRVAVYGRRKTKGRKLPPMYRSRKNPKLTWAGRGATPIWMRTEMKGTKLKKQDFLIK